ncbi:DUF2892 domain-containing protein [Heyndrickxia acidicola]|uniref:DUF2892 domain-containing protein n=1 Tax=Heyndrickxia acidicola TaxID=209389 RepID=A0ABU6MF33_9BACI|nr:DUF2892 domain-containing protein [Heyndrickxia acidicola]MED1202656.1 DUF2892 domain-containing protein [Heyndrickxia acidicola]
MKITQNIGIINAMIRITCGLTVLAWSTSKLVKRPWRSSYLLMAMMGAMKVAEGIVRYCPLTALIQSADYQNGHNTNRNTHNDHASPDQQQNHTHTKEQKQNLDFSDF